MTLQFRAVGRRLEGVVLRYGDRADLGGAVELVRPGAFDPIGDVRLNVQHRRDRLVARTGAGLVLIDGPRELSMRADVAATRDGDDVLTMVRHGLLRGLSVEFIPSDWSTGAGGVIEVKRARLVGIGVVDSPAYKGSTVQARAALYASSSETTSIHRPGRLHIWL